jgi:hypothetical protein
MSQTTDAATVEQWAKELFVASHAGCDDECWDIHLDEVSQMEWILAATKALVLHAQAVDAAVLAEREACARIAESVPDPETYPHPGAAWGKVAAEGIAKAIRARV